MLILFIAAGALIWWGLDRAEHRAEWLRVEAPRHAVVGLPLPMRVQVVAPAQPGYLCVDLHWGSSHDKPMHFLASGGSKVLGRAGGTFDFQMAVPPREGLRFVAGVIYLSRTTSWNDRILAASTELIPVVSTTAGAGGGWLEPLRVHPSGGGSAGLQRPAAGPRLLTGLIFLMALAVAWTASPPVGASPGFPSSGSRWWRVLVVLLALACLWELFGLESRLDEQARAMAQAGDLYYLRAGLQKGAISVVAAATLLLFAFVRRLRKSGRLLLISLALYLGISAVNLASLHVVDVVADLSWLGITLVQALKLACAVLVLLGIYRAKRGLQAADA